MKKWIPLLLCILLLTGCAQTPPERPDDGRLRIVATVFPAYDFARAAGGELADVTLLLPPGAESHSYEPTPADILAVQDCDLFLYLGGESDAWVDTILSAVEMRGAGMRMIDCVDLLEEETVEGMQSQPGHDHDHEEHDHDGHDGHDHESHGLGQVVEMDEHVWTSPRNAAAITRAVGEKLAELDAANAAVYAANAEGYAARIDGLDGEFAAFFDSQPSRTIVFGDRFPLRYFAEEYGLDYYAAFPGCGTQTEPSAATIAFLTDKVQAEQIPTVWYIEFSNHLVADSIAEATGARTAMFHTCHNVSGEELAGGATYLSLMEGNLETLRRFFA
ncbi:MAG: metal ABC transporter substrate-binding protein [Oscillospiraceae bacterium]|nr:metal ABC transporter substrate-binding protein [Oscillospiraceae bacterium]